MDAPDAGTGGGDAHPVDGGDGTPPPDVHIDEPAAEPSARATTDDDEDDDDPDLSADAEVTPERFKRVTAKLAKLNRRDRSFRVERARLKDLRDHGVTLDDLIHGTRQHRELAEQIANNPVLRKLVNGDEHAEETRRDAPAAKTEPDDPDFDETSLPFDPNESETNKYFADLAKKNHALTRTAKQLEARLNQIEGKDTARTQAEQADVERQERTTWKSAIDAAAATIDDDMTRILFKDALTAAFHDRAKHRLTPQQIIAHYLKGKVTTRQAATATAAATKAAPVRTAATQQRIAEQNKTLPRTVAPQGGPASARTGKESLNDVRRRLTGSKAKW